MKTNVTMRSSDRELFGITIRQNTKGEMLSVSDLQKAYDRARWIHGWKDRSINDITKYRDFHERLYHLLYERGTIKTTIIGFTEMIETEGVVKVMKGLGVWKTTGRGENRTVVCDPYIWVLLAMEMNPMIYAKVVIWLTDTLIFDRIEAGTEFMPMNSAIKRIVKQPDYARYCRLINEAVFGNHQRGMRQLASAKELRRISDIEKFIAKSIELEMIRNEKQLIKTLESYKDNKYL